MLLGPYLGYNAEAEFEGGCWTIQLIGISDFVTGQCRRHEELVATLQDVVDEYIADCKQLGKQPNVPRLTT